MQNLMLSWMKFPLTLILPNSAYSLLLPHLAVLTLNGIYSPQYVVPTPNITALKHYSTFSHSTHYKQLVTTNIMNI